LYDTSRRGKVVAAVTSPVAPAGLFSNYSTTQSICNSRSSWPTCL